MPCDLSIGFIYSTLSGSFDVPFSVVVSLPTYHISINILIEAEMFSQITITTENLQKQALSAFQNALHKMHCTVLHNVLSLPSNIRLVDWNTSCGGQALSPGGK